MRIAANEFNETACHFDAFFILYELPLSAGGGGGGGGGAGGPFLSAALERPVLTQRGHVELP